MGMVNTTIMLKPKSQWRAGHDVRAAAGRDGRGAAVPGIPEHWTQPIRNRLDMLFTGIKTPVGIKILGPDLERDPAARAADRAASSARRRHAQRVRGARRRRATSPTWRSTATRSRATASPSRTCRTSSSRRSAARTSRARSKAASGIRSTCATSATTASDMPRSSGCSCRLRRAARCRSASSRAIALTPGPAMIRDENGQLAGYVYVDTNTRDLGGYVDARRAASRGRCTLPQGTRCRGRANTSSRCARASGCASCCRSCSASSCCCCT